MSSVSFVSASPEVKSAVFKLFARRMGEALAMHPRGDLENETVCGDRLFAAGYSASVIFNLGPEARFQAWKILEPHLANRAEHRRWLTRHVPVAAPVSMMVPA